jgi:hypothetical protein
MDITDLVNNAMNQWAEETNCGATDPAFGGEIGEDIDKLVDGLSVFEVKTLLKTEKPIVFVEGTGVGVNRLVDADRLIKQIHRVKGSAYNNLDKKIVDAYIMALEEVEIIINDLV